MAALAIVLTAGAPAAKALLQATSAADGQLDAGIYHTCAVLAGADIRCWGFSGDGQLGYGDRSTIGDNETPGSVGPVNLGAGRTVKAVAAGDYHTCALLDNQSVRCWGYAFDGQLGYGDRNQIGDDEAPGSVGPVDLDPGPGTGRAVAISAGGRHTCAVLDDASVRCWGLGDVGQLGYGTTVNIGDNETPGSVEPVDLDPGPGTGRAVAIAAGGRHTCAVLDDGSVRCWGYGGNGQLGYAETSPVRDPGSVGPVDLDPGAGTGRAVALSAGDSHTCAVLDDGGVRCWGYGGDGELGYGTTSTIGDNETPGSVGPVDLDPGAGTGRAVAISTGAAHTCALLDAGSVRCWGLGTDGRLGYGNTSNVGDNETPGSVAPVDVGTGRTAVAVGAGQAHTCARLDGGNVRCWGYAGSGRLGSCNANSIGDDEAPGSVGPIDLETPGSPCTPPSGGGIGGGSGGGGSGTTPGTGGPQTSGGGSSPPPTGGAPGGGASVDPLTTEARRARQLRSCLAGAKRTARRKRDSARRACLKRYGRTPGRVQGLKARAASENKIVLTFSAPGTDGPRPPAARAYLVKQSPRAIGDARDFARAQALCKGSCRFKVTRVGTKITLTVTDLRPKTTYYYAVAALDNVSGRLGPRSTAVKAQTQ